jgi:hypothetical protein
MRFLSEIQKDWLVVAGDGMRRADSIDARPSQNPVLGHHKNDIGREEGSIDIRRPLRNAVVEKFECG